ncbi:MAG: bifunctional hydroxymethylpyrimidine kinase/phosphomethylpyrimidine kinase [Alistipes sp.]|nr:bifunctional hydroxymethylpyrimidine kinase/phosphomethylpyrimidine kinase [Alistipes sp.]MBQ7311914.1 bifunctional hydroxymethylpyrimidine kinase/phosphomethylpyrimidine kinase [Alistipes sp.]
MRLLAITRPELYVEEIREAIYLLENVVDILHIRKPNATAEQVEHLLCALRKYRDRIVLHDHFDLAVKYSLAGIHLNRRNSTVPLEFRGTISRSCHSAEEVVRYKAECDYVFLSPIFDSISKEGYRSAFTADELEALRDSGVIDSKVYALGGVTMNNLQRLKALGFGGAAMLGAAWKHRLTPPVVLTVAGSDSSGGAGIQADIKTISALRGFAASAITAVTAQNTMGVTDIVPLTADAVRNQAVAVFEDLDVKAVKIGMVHNSEVVKAVADVIEKYRPQYTVCDPVMVATSGAKLIEDKTVATLVSHLFPLSTLVTPNLREAAVLLGREINSVDEMKRAAKELSEQYRTAVLIKGGHLLDSTMCDVLCRGSEIYAFDSQRVESRNTHGTGCTLSSAIATYLAHGYALNSAVRLAKEYVTKAIEQAKELSFGRGNGALWHFGE